MARVELYLEGEVVESQKAMETLHELVKRHPQRIEAYLKLWAIFYTQGCSL